MAGTNGRPPEFTAELCRTLRPLLEGALKDVAAQQGLTIRVGNASYLGGSCTFKLECALVGQDGRAETKEVVAFRQLAPLYDLKAEWLGVPFKVGRDEYKIVGLNTKAKRQPVIVERTDGKRFKMEVGMVRMGMERGAAVGA